MRKPLFEEYKNPYARLVNAVQHDIPSVHNSSLPAYLIEACRAALVKDPDTRLRLASWGSFAPPANAAVGTSARERVTQRSLIAEATTETEQQNFSTVPEIVDAVVNLIKVEARRIRNENTTAFPPLIAARMPPGANHVLIIFRATHTKQLAIDLSLEIGVDVLDEKAQAIDMRIHAWLGSKDARPEDGSSVCVYKGLFVPDSISETLESAMYVSMDRAQLASGIIGTILDLSELEVKS